MKVRTMPTARNPRITRLPRYEPGSPEWHAQRARALGGSEIAAVLGLSKWLSPFALWHIKAGTITPDPQDNPSTEWGKRLEPVIAATFAEKHRALTIRRVGAFTRPDRPYMIVSPDRIATRGNGTRAVLEIKTARYGESWEWGPEGTDAIPPYYRAQVMWYLDALGIDVAYVVVLIGGSEYREYTIIYNAAEAELLRAAAVDFLDSVDGGHPPDLDGSESTYYAIRQLHPDIDDITVDVPEHVAVRFAQALYAVAGTKSDLAAATSAVAAAMGSARVARCNGAVIARRQARNEHTPPYVVAARGARHIDTTALSATIEG